MSFRPRDRIFLVSRGRSIQLLKDPIINHHGVPNTYRIFQRLATAVDNTHSSATESAIRFPMRSSVHTEDGTELTELHIDKHHTNTWHDTPTIAAMGSDECAGTQITYTYTYMSQNITVLGLPLKMRIRHHIGHPEMRRRRDE